MDWYPDPADPARERYWDGERWTHNTRPMSNLPTPQAPAQDPWSAAPAQPMTQGQAPQQGQAAQPGQPGPWGPQQPGYGPYQGGLPAQGQPGPYTAAIVKRTTTADGVPLAGWWSRAFAFILDNILVSLLTVGLGWNFASQLWHNWSVMWNELMAQARAGNQSSMNPDELMNRYDLTAGTYSLQAIGAAVLFAYLLLMWKFVGATLGQLLLGIRVVPAEQGQAPRQLPWAASVMRSLAFSLIAQMVLLEVISLLMPLWTQRRQTLHDLVARTQVVRRR